MKFIPDALGRFLGESELMASEKAPKVLFVGGVVGMVGSTVLACRATLQLSDRLDKIEAEKAKWTDAKNTVDAPNYPGKETYPDKEYKRDMARLTAKGLGEVARLYAPAVIVGGISIFALTKSHNLLRDRNLALTAAYAAVDGAYMKYRERVRERYGEDVDREILYESEHMDIVDDETGEIVATEVVTDAPGSAYKRWYDSESAPNWSPNHDANVYFLKCVQQTMNNRLQSKGHVFLNEVFDALGLKHTHAGAVVGWVWNKGTGDDFIDFGCWNNEEDFDPFFGNGRDGAILLNFNVDGLMYNRFEEG